MTQLLIIKNHINEIKKFCDQKGINYEIYNSSLGFSRLHAEKKEKEKLRQQLIKGYQAQAKNEKLQQELRILEEASLEDVFSKLGKKDNVNKKKNIKGKSGLKNRF